jgi:multidrug efflux pump subunit AcrA (membrane-fusion protein)
VTDTPPPGTSAEPEGAKKNRRGTRGAHAAGSAPANDKPAKYVTMQPVTTSGESGDTGLIISKGLKAGDLVVTAGQFRLKEGSKVTPMKPGEIPAPPTTAEIKAAAKDGGRGRRR